MFQSTELRETDNYSKHRGSLLVKGRLGRKEGEQSKEKVQ